jgi:alcohol dehydrogenase class IV
VQKEFIGKDSFKKIQYIVDELNAKRVLLVTGKKSFSLSGAKSKINKLLKNQEVTIFDDFQSNPRLEDVESGVNFVRQNNPDLIIAIGGGSVLDMAKLINILSVQNSVDFFYYIKNPNLINNKGVPLVAIPTTAGSGSQATHFAVVYIEKRKYSLAHNYLLPDYVVVDPALSYKTSKKVAASSAMDALSQAIESYWSLNATHESQHYARDAIKLILRSIDLAVNSKDKDAMQTMSLASHLSGKAINITKTTAPHAISYTLTSNFNIPHGYAVALLLAPVAYVSFNNASNKYKDIMKEIFELFDCKSIDEFYKIWIQLMQNCGLHSKLEDSNIFLDELDFIVDNINVERLKGHPVLLRRLDLEHIVRMAIIGY